MFQKSKRYIPLSWIFVFIGISILVIAILVTSPSVPLSDPSSHDEVVTAQETLRLERFSSMKETTGSAVLVNDQIRSSSVLIEQAVFSIPGYVTIFADDEGVPGTLLGTSLLLEGEQFLFSIEVEETLQEGVYYAVLYRDDGDGEFSGSDLPLVSEEGIVMMMSFLVTPFSELIE